MTEAAKTPTLSSTAEVSGVVAEIFRLYDAGDYRQVARLGPALVEQNRSNYRLILSVANSFAWTGRYEPANALYERLTGSPLETDGIIGRVSILRWRGMPDEAATLMRKIRSQDANETRVLDTRELLQRDLKTSLTTRIGHERANDGQQRVDLALVGRTWLNDNRARIDITGLHSDDTKGSEKVGYRDVRASVFLPGLAFAPRFEMGLASGLNNRTVGGIYLEPVRDTVGLRFGRVNWGRTSFNVRALQANLVADQIGGSLNIESEVGRIRVRADHYQVSDGNRLTDAEINLTPVFQPLPLGLVWNSGINYRAAQRNVPEYWSPNPAYAVGTFALKRSWFWREGEFQIGTQRGFPLNKDNKASWSGNMGAKYWISPSLLIAGDLSHSVTPRPSPYRYSMFAASLQVFW